LGHQLIFTNFDLMIVIQSIFCCGLQLRMAVSAEKEKNVELVKEYEMKLHERVEARVHERLGFLKASHDDQLEQLTSQYDRLLSAQRDSIERHAEHEKQLNRHHLEQLEQLADKFRAVTQGQRDDLRYARRQYAVHVAIATCMLLLLVLSTAWLYTRLADARAALLAQQV
jgi:Fe2+ transport system protein B